MITNNFKKLSIIFLLLFPVETILAGDLPIYMGVDYFRMQDKAVPERLQGLTLRLGYDFNNYLGVEGYASRTDTTKTSYTVSSLNYDVNYKVNYSSGLVLRGNLRFNRNRMALFAFAGMGASNADIEFISANTTIRINETSPVYGVGLDLYGTRRAAITLTAGTYLDKKINGVDTKITSYSLGFTYYFGTPDFSKHY